MKPVQMTEKQLSLIIAQMDAVTLAITEKAAIGAHAFPHPFPVTERLETVFPYIHKIIAINISLMKAATDTGASRYGAVRQDRADTDSGITSKKAVAYLALITAQKALTTVVHMYLALFAGTLDVFHYTCKFLVTQLKLRM